MTYPVMKSTKEVESYNNVSLSERLILAGQTAGQLALGNTIVLGGGEAATVIEPREYQQDAWRVLDEAREQGKDRAFVHLATGLGKTTVAVVDVAKFCSDYIGEHGKVPRILFACHQNEILDQAAERFNAFMPDMPQGRYSDGKKQLEAPLTFATMQSLRRDINKLDPDQFDYIIYDEAHHTQANTFKTVVEHFKPSFQLALTATPDRMDEKNIRDLFGEAVYKKTLAEAIDEGHLADVDYHIVFDEAVKKAMDEGFDPSTLKEINQLLKNESRNDEIAGQIKEKMHEVGLDDAKTIIFCSDIAQTEEMAGLLGGEAYHSSLKKQKRAKILDDFRNKNLYVITARDMFNEGIDIPDARLIVFLRSTGSRTVFEQQLGRGLRKHEGKDIVSVLDFVANIERLEHIDELKEEISKRRGYGSNGREEGDLVDIEFVGEGEIDLARDSFSTRTEHGNFDFDRISINLLSKIKDYQRGEMSQFRRLSNEELVTLALEISPNKPLSRNQIDSLSQSDQFVSASSIIKRFGTTRSFQEACGFEPIDWVKHASDEDLISMALKLSPDKPLSQHAINKLSSEDNFASASTISKRFGGLAQFHKACGFESGTRWSDMSDEELIERAQELSPDKPLTQVEMQKLSKSGEFVSTSTIYSRFGSVTEFHKQCGFQVRDWALLSNEEIVEIAKEISPDEPLNSDRIRKLSKDNQFIGETSLRERFGGSVRNFHEACGFKDWKNASTDELVTQALTLSPDKPLTAPEIRELSKQGKILGYSGLRNRFGGSFKNFQKEVWGGKA